MIKSIGNEINVCLEESTKAKFLSSCEGCVLETIFYFNIWGGLH